jgi:hypothetical protein
VLSTDLHAFGDRYGARWLWLWLTFDFDEASSAGCNWLKKWVIAEARNLNANLFGSANYQGAFGHLHFDAVNRDIHEFYWSVSHANQPFALTKTVEDIGLNA